MTKRSGKVNNSGPKKATVRTSAGLCEALFDEFDALRNGESDSHRASAVAKIAIQIIATKRLEMDAAALVKGSGRLRPVTFDAPVLRLAA